MHLPHSMSAQNVIPACSIVSYRDKKALQSQVEKLTKSIKTIDCEHAAQESDAGTRYAMQLQQLHEQLQQAQQQQVRALRGSSFAGVKQLRIELH